MEKVIQSVEVPFFYGFYDSPLDNSEHAIFSELEYYRNEVGLRVDWDDFDFDMQGYQNAVSKAFIEVAKDSYLPNWIESIKFNELWHPPYYNFQNDKLYATVILTNNWKELIEQFFNENREWLTERIKKDWTSRDGFMSLIHNDYEAFYDEVMQLETRYLSIVWKYVIALKNPNVNMYMEMAVETMEKFSENDNETWYVTLNKKEDKMTNDNGNRADNV